MVAAAWLRVRLCLGALGLLSACARGGVFACEESPECEMPGAVGRCDLGYCAFADVTCPSGLRYGEHAPAGIAGQCTEPVELLEDGSGPDDDDGKTTKGPLATSDDAAEGDDGDDESTSEGSTTDDTAESGGFIEMPSTCAEDLVDEFPGADLHSRWQVSATTGVGALYAGPVNGDLVVEMYSGFGGSGWVETGLGPFVERSVEVESLIGPDETFALGWFAVRSDVVHRMEIKSGTLRVVDGPDADAPPQHEVPFDPDGHRWLRMTAIEAAIRYEAAPDGESWVTLFVTPQVGASDFTILEIGVGTWGPTTIDPRITATRVAACTWSE
jgi:hypothetical protein